MRLLDLVNRAAPPAPWAEGDKIPWNEPGFSARMLREHLSQSHGAASRQFDRIDSHVDWVHVELLQRRPARILDLGCGPGLYAERLARLGHACVGIDFSPASIAYATKQATDQGLDCVYSLADLRHADYGSGFDLAMQIFGEFNVFKREDILRILHKAHSALAPNGLLLLEPHSFDRVRDIGCAAGGFSTHEAGLFSEQPHLLLQENFWDEESNVATSRYYVIDAESGDVTRHMNTMQAYAIDEYRAILQECGFADIRFWPALATVRDGAPEGLIAIEAVRAP